MDFTVLSFNMHKGFNAWNKFTLPAMREQLQKLDPDLICLQEVQGKHVVKQKKQSIPHGQNQAAFIAENHWPEPIYVENAQYKNGHHGNAIISRYPVDFYENINISFRKTASRSLLHARIPIAANLHIHLICVHFGLFELEREDQFAALIARVNSHIADYEPLIIAGDFNDWRKRAGNHLSTLLHLREAFADSQGQHAKTFPAFRPLLSVDRIYYRHLHLLDARVIKQKPWGKLSDHLPLLAKFEI
jgi:endonuclease/exonuclease/phosphatase family metal-dependent hydrolase